MGWQWHQLDHLQIICTLLQTDNHASTSPLSFLQGGCPSCHTTNSVKALKANRWQERQKTRASYCQRLSSRKSGWGKQLLEHVSAAHRTMYCITSIVLYTKVDAQCDKLAMVVGRTKSTTLVTVDVPWQNFSKSLGQSSSGKYRYFWRHPNSIMTQW